jgi:hypothetical protein
MAETVTIDRAPARATVSRRRSTKVSTSALALHLDCSRASASSKPKA